MSYKEEWLNSCFSAETSGGITVYYKDGREPAQYTKAIIKMLKEEKSVSYITDDETGDILYDRDDPIILKLVDEDVNGCGEDVETLLEIKGPAISEATADKVKKAIAEYIKGNSDYFDSDGCFDVAEEVLKESGYEIVRRIEPHEEIVF